MVITNRLACLSWSIKNCICVKIFRLTRLKDDIVKCNKIKYKLYTAQLSRKFAMMSLILKICSHDYL